MVAAQPQFLLFCDAQASEVAAPETAPSRRQVFGRWHFVLERLDGPEHLEVVDSEVAIHPDRLALLSVVRGLEALEQPSRVNLVTTSRYVSRGLKYGLSTWRESEYRWERFGVQKPIRNADLWQRIDHALQFHGVTCRLLQSNLAAAAATRPRASLSAEPHPTHLNRSAQEQPTPLTANSELATQPVGGLATPSSRQRPLRLGGRFGQPAAASLLSLPTLWWEILTTWLKWRGSRLRPRPQFSGL